MKSRLIALMTLILTFMAVRAGPVSAATTERVILDLPDSSPLPMTMDVYDVTDEFWATNPATSSAIMQRQRQLAIVSDRRLLRVRHVVVDEAQVTVTLPRWRDGHQAVYLMRSAGKAMQSVVVRMPLQQTAVTVAPKPTMPPLPDTGGPPHRAGLPAGQLPQTGAERWTWLATLGAVGLIIWMLFRKRMVLKAKGCDK